MVLLLLISGPSSAAPEQPVATFHTSKNLPMLEQCLTEKLSKQGDVTSINADGYVTLMYKENAAEPMLIDLAPPNVTVTTKVTFGTGYIIRSCL